MAKITWTAEAQRWLEDIFEYIAADNPQAALETVQGIYERTQVLVNFPEIGHRYGHPPAMCESSCTATTVLLT
jgi:plasmid stabilization system protein ParE